MNSQSAFQIVFDTADIEFQNNRVFDPKHAAKFPGALVWSIFRDRAKERGWDIMTSDVFLKNPGRPMPALCISEMITPFTARTLAAGAVPFIILSGESPNVAYGFYHNLGKYTRPYRHAFLFRGAGARVKSPTLFHPLYWSNTCRDVRSGLEWDKRQFLVMIAGNKQRLLVNEQKPLKGMRRLVKKLIWSYLHLTDELFRFEDLYQRRLDAICYFAGVPGFKLFGTGWDKKQGLYDVQWQAIQKLEPVFVEDKMDVLSHFRFALCFENCIFPGYVTEKIFDCFLAGCIPVYLGAPDISDFVPPSTFIDYRNFGSYSALDKFMREMTESETIKYLEAARGFLASPEFDKFTADCFVKKIINLIDREMKI